jgi:DNA-binding transcriptional MocR family regulator
MHSSALLLSPRPPGAPTDLTERRVSMERKAGSVPLYEQLAANLHGLILKSVYLEGERVPSVRQTSQHHRVSVTTVLKAYLLLESRGVIESRPQSGYFVRPRSGGVLQNVPKPREVSVSSDADGSRLVLSTLRSIQSKDAAPLGSPYPDQSQFPWQKINQYVHAISRRQVEWNIADDLPPGNPALIREIAKRYMEHGMAVDPGEIVVTAGATEALNLCLQAVAKPGDAIAIESPAHYTMLHAIERMGMHAVEIRTDPTTGMNLMELERAIDTRNVQACMVMPNFQNPLGFQMSDARKRALVDLISRRELPVIENDVYSELYFGDTHPTALKTYDTKGLVLHCSSFSKALTSAVRIGWTMAGRYRSEVEKLKFVGMHSTSSISQMAITEYLRNDGYDHHLRKVRRLYQQQAKIMAYAVQRFFPVRTRVSTPAGGYVMWVELPGEADSTLLYGAALERGITVAPGRLFSISEKYRNCIRLNYSYPWTPRMERAVETLGQLAYLSMVRG